MKKENVDIAKSSPDTQKALRVAASNKAAKAAAITAAKSKRTNPVNKTGKFVKDLKSEWRKIVWPTRKQVLNNTGVVLTAMIVTGGCIWGFDSLLSLVIKRLLKID